MQRNSATALAVAALICVTACLLHIPDAHALTHDGWCHEGEGQAVVVDPNPPEPFGPPKPVIVRCIQLPGGPGAMSEYPVDDGHPLGAPLDSAGIPYRVNAQGLIVDVAGYETPEGYHWHYVRGKAGAWLGRNAWNPEPIVDTMVGIRLTQSEAAPVEVPKLLPAPPPAPSEEPTPEPSGEPSEGPTGEPSEGPTGEPSEGPTGEPTEEPTGPPSPDPGDEPSPDPSDRPTPDPGPPAAPGPPPPTPPPPAEPPAEPPPPRDPPDERTPQPTRRPPEESPERPSPTSPPPISESEESDESEPESTTPTSEEPNASVSPSQDPEATTLPVEASPSPSRVWGEESIARSPGFHPTTEPTSPWAPWAVAMAGLVILGGLGSSFAGTRRDSAPPNPVEDE